MHFIDEYLGVSGFVLEGGLELVGEHNKNERTNLSVFSLIFEKDT